MRCPKCSFISFDVVDTCAKCGKNINKAAEELQGTVASMTPPAFLRFDFPAPEEETVEEGTEQESEEAAFDLGGEEEEVFVDFSAEEDTGIEAETAELDIAEDVAGDMAPEEGAIDIADLAPSEEAVEEAVEETEDFALVTEETPEARQEAGGQGLADLKVEGIDLEASPAPPSGSGKVMPSVKTGTALDDFDIDLGDLLPKK